MGILDLPAFINTVLAFSSFPKLALVAHSQGTTLTFLALAKKQLPNLGEKISIFCALAPAVYAGSLIDRFYFKFMRIISPRMFRLVFGIHAFIPVMMFMQRHVPRKLYGALGYRVFAFLFGWSDLRWDRGLRDRFFQFAPVYVSAENMRWWLGKECFARQRCILATVDGNGNDAGEWFDEKFPKLALWVAKEDKLVDGMRLLRRLEEREKKVRIVWKKVLDGYEHLDVVWAMDAVESVFSELRGVVWRELGEEERRDVVVPEGCAETGETEAAKKK
jgi:pimeloyl-ACP methyl ester carboxylesterase